MKFIIEAVIIFSLSIVSAIGFSHYKKIPIFPKNIEVFLYSRKYPEIEFIDAERLYYLIKKNEVFLIDAREKDEYIKGHIEGAVNFPYSEFYMDPAKFIDKIDTQRKIVVYCEGGFCELSFKVAEILKDLGIKDLVIYIGGFNDWKKRNYPVETGL
ncbi:MAG: rhodanese-like domain-containing protein [Candidatus Hydrothermales bacterium]